MTIGQYRGIMRQAVNSGARRNGGVPPPPYGDYHFPTKAAPAMSEDEYREAIIEQAKKDQSEGKFQTQSEAYKKLQISFNSVVSPDRKAAINEGLPMILKNMKRRISTCWIYGLAAARARVNSSITSRATNYYMRSFMIAKATRWPLILKTDGRHARPRLSSRGRRSF